MIRAFAIIVLGLFLLTASLMPFFTVNTTASYPVGIYSNISKKPAVGDLVSFCPPKNAIFDMALERGYLGAGYCSGKYGLLIKKILAAKGDNVEISPGGILVNGELIKNSRPRQQDGQGRELPQQTGNFQLRDGEALLVSDFNPFSFDARYFGILEAKFIRTALKPLFTW